MAPFLDRLTSRQQFEIIELDYKIKENFVKSDAAAQFYLLKKALVSKKQNTDQIKKALSSVTSEQIETFF